MTQEELKKLVESASEQIKLLRLHNYAHIEDHLSTLQKEVHEFTEAGNALLEESDTLQIGIVGQVKAGKSSFLNALFFEGENILPRASTPMTAGVTILEYSDKNSLEVDYFSKEDWEFFDLDNQSYLKTVEEVKQENPAATGTVLNNIIKEKTTDQQRVANEMVEKCSDAARLKISSASDVVVFNDYRELQDGLEKFVGAEGEFTSVVKSLRVKLHDERLKGLRIVDTPGVNDPVQSREDRTRAFLQSCHGVFLLSSSSDFFGQGDVSFLKTRIGNQGIAKVVLIASKFDSVLQGMEFIGRDLADAASEQFDKFERRLNEQKKQLTSNIAKDIVLDYTSGISYSIIHKSPAQWDEMEKNVVNQMKRFYPEDFATPEQSKESFGELANIAGIEEQYLQGIFLSNKDSIMREKIEAFFASTKDAITESLNKTNARLQLRHKELTTKSIEEIQKQKKSRRNSSQL